MACESFGGRKIDLDPAQLILVVVGAHLHAEAWDRPSAVWLVSEIRSRLTTHQHGSEPTATPLVCTDIWALNDETIRACPVISIGEPGVNAMSAKLIGRVPKALVVDNEMSIDVDTAFEDLRAVCWGVGPSGTAAAVRVFAEKYLDPYIEAVLFSMGR